MLRLSRPLSLARKMGRVRQQLKLLQREGVHVRCEASLRACLISLHCHFVIAHTGKGLCDPNATRGLLSLRKLCPTSHDYCWPSIGRLSLSYNTDVPSGLSHCSQHNMPLPLVMPQAVMCAVRVVLSQRQVRQLVGKCFHFTLPEWS